MIQSYLDASREQFDAFMALPINGPLKMVNLLKFKHYVEETGKSGEKTYQDYLKATTPFFAQVNGKISFMAKAEFSLIGPEEKEWDMVLIAEYVSKADFVKMVTMEGYPSHLRKQALADSRLIFCQ